MKAGFAITGIHWVSSQGKVWFPLGDEMAEDVWQPECYLCHLIPQGTRHLKLLHSETENNNSNATG